MTKLYCTETGTYIDASVINRKTGVDELPRFIKGDYEYDAEKDMYIIDKGLDMRIFIEWLTDIATGTNDGELTPEEYDASYETVII